MLTEECLTEIGDLFKKAQYQKCKKSLLKCLSDFEVNYGAAQNNVLCEDFCKNSGGSESSAIVSSSCSLMFRCIFQHNRDVCTFLCRSIKKESSDDEIKLAHERFNRLLQDMHGLAVSDHHLDIELITLYNYLITLLGHHVFEVQEWSETAFMLINTALNRAFEIRTGSVASVHRPITEEIVSLVDGILLHSESMTELALESVTALCYAVFYLLIICNISLPVHYIKKIMSKIEKARRSKKLQKCRPPGFVCMYPSNLVTPGVPSHNDLLQLVLACNYMAMKDIHNAHTCMEMITYSGWEHFTGYIKAFLLFKEKKYDLALENSWPLWKTKQRAGNWMVSRLSNFIGCCLFKKGCFSMSLKWFQKSINLDFTCLLPLWNMAAAFECLGKNDSSLAILEILEKTSLVSSDKHPSYLFCNYLWLQNQPEITRIEAVYLLAHQCLSFRHYSLSAEHFTKILHLVKERPLEAVPHSVHFPVSLLSIYVEVCYAYLHARMYEACLKTGNSAVEYFSISSTKQNESFFSWDVSKELLETSHFNHHTKSSISTGKFVSSHLFPLSNHSVHSVQTGVKPNNSLLVRNESDATFLKPDSSVTDVKVDKKGDFSHNHIKPYRIMHLIIEASAKYSLNCISESVDTLRRALTATTHFCETEEYLDTKDQDHSVATFSEDFCQVCSNIISSLRSQIFNNLAVISISKGHLTEAAHNLRIAVMHDSGNIDAIYNYCLLQIKLEQTEVAQSFWEASKLRCDTIKCILASDDCNSTCTVSADLLKSLNEAFSSEV